MAVVSEPPWVNFASGVSARNGTTTHTIPFGFTSTTGNELVVIVGGAVTHANAGWTARVAPVLSGGVTAFTKTSAGESSFTDTVNGSNYTITWVVYELPAGSTWTASSSSNPTTNTYPALPGLPGTEVVVWGCKGRVLDNNTRTQTAGWTGPWVSDADFLAADDGSTDGYYITIGRQNNVTATSITPASTETGNVNAGDDRQIAVFAMNVAALGPTVSAGADAAHTVSTQFARTGTESGLTSVTARNWEIVSGPGGAVSSIGTAAALTWTPTAVGAYVLRYSATHSTGTATDDATITVGYARISTDITDLGTSTMVGTASGATTVAPGYPTGVATGDAVYAYLHVRGGARTVTTPANWALVGSVVSGTTSAEGAGVGPTRTHVYKRIAGGALTGSQSFTISAQATSGVAMAYMRAFRAAGTGLAYDDLTLLGWSNPTTGTGAGSATPNGALTVAAGQFAAKDVVQVSVGASDDALTSLVVGSITCTGATFGATSDAPARGSSANGNDMTTAGATAVVTAGSNSGTTLNVPVTFNAAEQMHGLVHRVRATIDDVPTDVDVTATVASGSGAAGNAQGRVSATAQAATATGAAANAVASTVTPVPTDVRVSFPTPSSDLTGPQEFRALVRRKEVSAPATAPTVAVELWESGAKVADVVTGVDVTSTAGQVVSGTWAATALAAVSGVNVECKVISAGSAGGTVEVGAVEWNALLSAPPATATATATVAAGTGAAGSAQGKVAATAGAPAGTGAATNATVSVSKSATAQVATATGAAGDATTSTASIANVNATVASGTGAAGDPPATVTTQAGAATGTGAAANAVASTSVATDVTATVASGSGAATNAVASVSRSVTAGQAAGAGAAGSPVSTVRVNPAGATGSGVAANATAATVQVTVVAGRARPVAIGGSVLLDVAATPPGGETISGYSWAVISGGGSLANATTATPTYSPPGSGNALAVIRATVTSTGGGVGTADSTVSFHTNVVAAENALTGVARTTWDLPTSALGGVATLQGFADGFTVDKGGTINFKIAQSDGAGWTANLYRLGYYAGNGARDYGSLNPTGGQVTTSQGQPSPGDADTTTTKLSPDCSNWSTTLSWTSPSWVPSGIYVLKLNRTGGGTSHVMFIVRDDARDADLMLMPSDTTWLAYNAWGGMGSGAWLAGNSLYDGTTVNQYSTDCARVVSYDKPVINRQAATVGTSYGQVKWSTFFTGEYPMLRFVERNGIDVKYYSCLDAAGDAAGTHLTGNGSTRGAVSAAMFVGHNEYWSDNMRDGWEAAKAAGVNIFSCAANEVFWRMVGVGANDAAGRPRRFECYKSTIAARGSTARAEWTGTWRDPTGAGKGGDNPENLFTGTIFIVNGDDLRALVVPFTGGYSAQPLWRHSTVAALTTGQSYTSGNQVIGFEWDTYGPAGTNGGGAAYLADPHPRARYCSNVTYSISSGILLTDAGDVYDAAGTATHRLVVHPNDGGNGGITFGTGTINWALGVDNSNTYQQGNDNTSTPIQQATVNMLADMGAPAATLMGGLTTPTAFLWFADIPATTATGTGSAGNASPGIGRIPTTATGTGSAGNAALSISKSVAAQAATGTGAAGAASVQVRATAVAATASGTASNATVSAASVTTATAQQAAATASAGPPTVRVATAAVVATGTGTAQNATAPAATNVAAQVAAGSGSATNPQAAVRSASSTATATGTAANAGVSTTGNTSVLPATATSSGVTGNATVSASGNTAATAQQATAAAAASNAAVFTSGNTSAPAVVASGTGTASNAGVSTTGATSVLPGTATTTGSAANAVASTSGNTSAAAQQAVGTGAGGTATVSTSGNTAAPATVATGSGVAANAGISMTGQTSALPATATSSGTAGNAAVVTSGNTAAPAQQATVTGAAGSPAAGSSVSRAAGQATATGAASNASVTAFSANSAAAQTANGTGTANTPNLSTSSRIGPQSATGAGAAGQAAGLVLKTVIPQTATGTGTTGPALIAVSAAALSAMASGQAFDTFAQLPVVRGEMRILRRAGPTMRPLRA